MPMIELPPQIANSNAAQLQRAMHDAHMSVNGPGSNGRAEMVKTLIESESSPRHDDGLQTFALAMIAFGFGALIF